MQFSIEAVKRSAFYWAVNASGLRASGQGLKRVAPLLKKVGLAEWRVERCDVNAYGGFEELHMCRYFGCMRAMTAPELPAFIK